MTTENLLPQERHNLILQRLLANGRVMSPDLARLLNVSEDTIRRDLRDLAAAGLCKKVYGGALRLPTAPDTCTLAQRRTQQVANKSRLAQAAVTQIVPGNILFIDAGSTNLNIADALPDVPLTIITNAPAIAALLQERSNIEVIMIGGRIDSRSGASLGTTALREVELMRPDLFILGACGVDAQAGVSAFHYDEAAFKRGVVAVSRAVLVATTDDKLGTAAPFHVLAPAQLTTLVVEPDADTSQTDAFSALGVRLLRAEEGQ